MFKLKRYYNFYNAIVFISACMLIYGCGKRIFPGKAPVNYEILRQDSDRVVARLDNRMVVVAKRMPAAPVVSAQLWVQTGSIFEQEYSGSGISHFLEHLLSGGTTTTRTEEESNEILGRIGAQKNAATGLDGVFYYINAPSAHSSKVIELLSDWIINASLPESEFQREREVIKQEFSMGEGEPGRILWRLTQKARYDAHPARHPTIGYIDEFLEITHDQVKDFYKRMYLPNNMVFSVAGDINPKEIVRELADIWEDVPAGELPEIGFPDEPGRPSGKRVSGRADIHRPRVRFAWPSTKQGCRDDLSLDLLSAIMGQGESSRLRRDLRDDRQLATVINSYNLSFSWGEGFFGVDAEVAAVEDYEEAVGKLQDAVLEHINKVRRETVSERELDRARKNIISAIQGGNQKVQDVASRLAEDIIDTSDPDYIYRYLKEIKKLTPQDLKSAARRYLDPQNVITVKLLPETEKHTAEPLKREKELDRADFPLNVYELDNRKHFEEIKRPREEEIERRIPEMGEYKYYELNNGLNLVVQKSNAVPKVSMHLYFKGGLLAEEKGREGRARAMTSMLTRGTQNYSAEDFINKIEDMGASISSSSGYNTDYVRASSLSEDWPEVMGLMAEAVLRPSFSSQQWDIIRPRLIASIDRQDDSWYGELSRKFRKGYFRDHQWSLTSAGRRETVENLTVEELRKYHQNRINAENAVISVVGDVEPDKVYKKARKYFGDMPAESKGDKEIYNPEISQPGFHKIDTAKPVAAVKIGFGPVVHYGHEDFPKMRVMSNIISDFPSGWLQRSLRGEGPGLVYASWARLVTGLVPGYFEVTFNTSREYIPEALERVMKVMERIRNEYVNQEDIDRAVSKTVFNEFFYRQSNSARAENAALDMIYGVEDPDGSRFRRTVENITPEEIKENAKKYLQNPVIFVMASEDYQLEGLKGIDISR